MRAGHQRGVVRIGPRHRDLPPREPQSWARLICNGVALRTRGGGRGGGGERKAAREEPCFWWLALSGVAAHGAVRVVAGAGRIWSEQLDSEGPEQPLQAGQHVLYSLRIPSEMHQNIVERQDKPHTVPPSSST